MLFSLWPASIAWAQTRDGEWVESTLRAMTLEEKVGQLFMVHVYGRTPTDPDYVDENLTGGRGARDFAEAIRRYHVSGFIYFNRNANISVPLDARNFQICPTACSGSPRTSEWLPSC